MQETVFVVIEEYSFDSLGGNTFIHRITHNKNKANALVQELYDQRRKEFIAETQGEIDDYVETIDYENGDTNITYPISGEWLKIYVTEEEIDD